MSLCKAETSIRYDLDRTKTLLISESLSKLEKIIDFHEKSSISGDSIPRDIARNSTFSAKFRVKKRKVVYAGMNRLQKPSFC